MGSGGGMVRLEHKVAIVVGAGQTPGQTVGNGRATAEVFAREGAIVVAVDVNIDAATSTVSEIKKNGGEAVAIQADATNENDISAVFARCVAEWGRIDVLHNNVGVSLAGGDAPLTEIDGDAFDRITSINLKSMVLACKHVLPIMRTQGYGSIVTISSAAAIMDYPYVSYKTSKAGVIALTQHVAITNASYGIRANCILPGLMNTPMAVENRIGVIGATREEVIARRDAQVPLGHTMGTGWDVANAALFLASDEARFITGVALPVDGGQLLKIG
jgi:NAD(P)-dependent dehydrogenase (short-subunit alcohol dehydrogenase family)